jgi:hypothetical protein
MHTLNQYRMILVYLKQNQIKNGWHFTILKMLCSEHQVYRLSDNKRKYELSI